MNERTNSDSELHSAVRISFKFEEQVMNANLTALAEMIEKLQAYDLIGQRPDPTITLQRLLMGMVEFSKARSLCRDVANEATGIVAKCRCSAHGAPRRTSRYGGSGWGNAGESIRQLEFHVTATFCDPSLIPIAKARVARANELTDELIATWQNHYRPVLAAVASDNEWYKAFKRELPYGAREALSILRVWAIGELSPNYGDQEHGFAGMQFRLGDCETAAIVKVQRKLRVARERSVRELSGPAPSLARGRRLLTCREYHHNSGRVVTAIDADLRRKGVTLPPLLGGRVFNPSDYVDGMGVTIYLALRDGDSRRAHRVGCRWIAGRIHPAMRCFPAAVVTGSPIQVNETDYAVPALWPGERRGLLLFRVGYNDCYHLTDAEYQTQRDSLGEFTRTRLSERADRHLRYQREQRETYEARRKTERKRISDILRGLRKLAAIGEVFTREDSYAVGNCRPGTAEFISDLGIQGQEASAADLATKWRAMNYVQRDLFGMVVQKLVSRNRDSITLTESEQSILGS